MRRRPPRSTLCPYTTLFRSEVLDARRPTTAPVVDADGIFFGVALSGGGSRSANFAAACMFELEQLGLLGRVDYLSSVSGGSRSEEHTAELQSRQYLVCRLLL